MTILLFNYAIFNNPYLLIVGWIIAGIEAITATLQFLRVVFRNNKKIVEKLDKSIAKCEKTLINLRQKQDVYRAVIAMEDVQHGELNANPAYIEKTPIYATKAAEPEEEPEPVVEMPADVEIPPADGVETIEPEEEPEQPADAPTTENNESYELFKKFVESVKKNDERMV